jgi:hypothetical protein
MSRRDYDDELQAAVRASREDGFDADEVGLVTAIQDSMDDQAEKSDQEK